MTCLDLCAALLGASIDICIPIVSKWLNVPSICRLDSACCNRATRHHLHALLSADHFALSKLPVAPKHSSKRFAKCVAWATIRKLKVRKMEIVYDLDTTIDGLQRYLNVAGSTITSIKFNSLGNSRSMGGTTAFIMKQCPNIHEVYCFKCDLDETFLALLQNYPKLRELCIEDCTGLHDVPWKLVRCPCMGTVSMVDCDINDSIVEAVMSPSDQILRLNFSVPTELSLRCVDMRFAQLRAVGLSYADVTDAAVLALCQYCAQLTAVDITGCKHLTDTSIVALVTQCQHLHTLWMGSNDALTDASLHAIAAHGSNLTNLDTTGCEQLTLEAQVQALVACRKLSSYFLMGEQKGIALASHLPCSIRSLILYGDATNSLLETIGQRCPQLEHLRLPMFGGNNNYMDAGIVALVRGCPQLTTVVIPDHELIKYLWQCYKPSLKILRCFRVREPELFSPSFEC